MGESCVDVDTGNKEEETSIEVGIHTFEVFPTNPTSREERELEDCGHSVHKNWRELVSKIVVQGNIFNLNRLEKE